MARGVRSRNEAQDERGRQATRPGEVPARGWLDVLKRTFRAIRETNASIVAAGVAFYAFLAVVPALIAVVAIYGLVANPAEGHHWHFTESLEAIRAREQDAG